MFFPLIWYFCTIRHAPALQNNSLMNSRILTNIKVEHWRVLCVWTNVAVSLSGRTQWTNWSRKPTWLCWWEPTAGEISSSKPSLWAQVGSPESCVLTLYLLLSCFLWSLGLTACENFRNGVRVCVCWNEKWWNPLFLTDERDQMADMLGTLVLIECELFCLCNHHRAELCSPGTAVMLLLELKIAAGRDRFRLPTSCH